MGALISHRLCTFLMVAWCFFISCKNEKSNTSQTTSNDVKPVQLDLEQIKKRGKLIALTGNSSTTYFVYKGKPMGYEYEMIKSFCDHIGVDLELIVVGNMNDVFEDLNNGVGDVICANLTKLDTRKKLVNFSTPTLTIHQVVIQREGEKAVSDVKDLHGKKVYVRKETSYYNQLLLLEDSLGIDIDIVEVPGDSDTEMLIDWVSNGQIDFTIADENIAKINSRYFSNINVDVKISDEQEIAWAIRKNSTELLESVSNWINSVKNTSDFATIYNKYYRSSNAQLKRAKSAYSSISGDGISEYDELLKKYCLEIDWDWRLVASQVYQESRFNPDVESWAGAVGLMQVMPETAKLFDEDEFSEPEINVMIGIRQIKKLDNYWITKVPDKQERIKFVLASYNVGLGHVIDARRLAEKYGKMPMIWDDNVAEFIKLKSNPKYYKDKVCRHGYCRGSEPFKYVKEILERYQHYKSVLT